MSQQRIASGQFSGVVTLRTWFGKYVGDSASSWAWVGNHPDYQDQPHEFEMAPLHGGYSFKSRSKNLFIRVDRDSGRFHWQNGMPSIIFRTLFLFQKFDRRAYVVGRDTHETLYVAPHPSGSGWTLNAKAREGKGPGLVAAEPQSHGVHLVANRGAAAQWEQFFIDVVQDSAPPAPTTPARDPRGLAYNCTCGHVVAYCGVPNAPPGTVHNMDRRSCPHCGRLYDPADIHLPSLHHTH